jgi:hypothetical protein
MRLPYLMLLFSPCLQASAADPPAFTVTNRCPPAFTVTSRLPAAASCPCGPQCGCAGLGYPVCGSPGCPAARVAAGPVTTFSPPAPFGGCAGGSCGPAPQSYAPARGYFRRW